MTTLKEATAEKLGKIITVQGITIEDVTPDTLNDFDFLEAVAIMSDPDAEDGESLRAMAKVGPIIFGARQWKRVKAELREQNGGKLTSDVVMGFVDETLAELRVKNS